jgi:hypothetical protein
MQGPNQNFSITSDAQSGTYAASLHHSRTGLDSLSQHLSTVVGQTYTLDFWLANVAAGRNTFIANVNGQALYSESNAGVEGYTEHTVQFTATTTDTVLQFQFQNSSNWLLEDVSVIDPPAANVSNAAPSPNVTDQVAQLTQAMANFSPTDLGSVTSPISQANNDAFAVTNQLASPH